MTRIGFLGVGHLAAEMIAGLLRAQTEPARITVSPRGYGPALATTHGLTLAADNAELVASTDIVLLATRPRDALSAIETLPWRSGQILISACAGVPLSELAGRVAPARTMRIMPLTASSLGASPTTVYPDLPEARPLLSCLGTVIPLTGEAQFEVATVSAAIYGWAQHLIGVGSAWSAAQGLPADTARLLVARTFVAAGRMIGERDEPVETLLESLVTPGGITERGLDVLGAHNVDAAWREACAAVLAKLTPA